jgi:hypothetical protein
LAICIGISLGSTIPQEQQVQQDKKKLFKFSHMLHIEDIGVDCASCHPSTAESKLAADKNLPTHDECFECHDGDTAGDECEKCHVDPDEPVELPNPSREYKFNHKLHQEKLGEESCVQCHPGLNEAEFAEAANMPPMTKCTECHDNSSAPQMCEACHTKVRTLRPVSHIPTWMNRHDDAVRSSTEDCASCHSFNYCQECHDGAVLAQTDKNITGRYTPNAPRNWGVNNMILSKNHDLNYRYTHGLEAKGKLEKCSLCHESESFCAPCHEVSGGGKPVWHSGADWGAQALAIGSGGGRHAQMAKRDISNCASCHDAGGEDPVCLQCHMDRIPGKGNELKTHEIKRYNGPWHDDKSYMCFTCHVNAQPKNPAGFCGYCHPIK